MNATEINRILRQKYDANGPREVTGRMPRFSPGDVADMKKLHKVGWSLGQIAREFKASRSLVTKYLRGFEPVRWRA